MSTVIQVDPLGANVRRGPRQTIVEALSSTAARRADSIELHVRKGRHSGQITIERPVSIVGEASSRADTVLRMSIRNPRGHDLAIRNVTLERRTGYPIIVQTGGTLTLNDIALVSRKPHRRSAHRKPAIPVACIVVRQHGFLKARHLAISQIDGVVIGLSGRGTTGILSFAEIRDNVVASSAIDADTVFGTIDVSSEAVLLIEQSVVANNDFCGICIHEQSRMHLRNATVTGTRGIDTTTGLFGGYNVWARPGATAELRDFEISNAICGIRVQAAYLTAEDGLVTNNTIGLSVDDPPNAYFFRCASLNVAYSQNERNLDSSTLPEPSTEPPPECARVPWIEG